MSQVQTQAGRGPRGRGPDPLLGATLGDYRLVEVLGKGGMATVYLGRRQGRNVAVKVLDPRRCKNPDEIKQFLREAQTMQRIDHPNVVRVFGVGEQDEKHYLTLELIRSGSLEDLLTAQGGKLSVDEAVDYARQIASGLAQAHRLKIVHRDIKPANVLVDEGPQLKITDFGLAMMVDGSQGALGKCKVVGTPHFMSPEQIDGVVCDGRTDIYALGASLYQLVTGTTPFSGKSLVELLTKHSSEPLQPPHERDRSVPRWLSDVIVKTMAKQRGDRYQRCEELLTELEARQFGASVDPAAEAERAAPPPPPPQALLEARPPVKLKPQGLGQRRHPVIRYGLAALVLAALGLVGVGQGAVRAVFFAPEVDQQALYDEQASQALASLRRQLDLGVESSERELRLAAERYRDFTSAYLGTPAGVEASALAESSLERARASEEAALGRLLATARERFAQRRLGPALDALAGAPADLSEEAAAPLLELRAEIEAELGRLGLAWIPEGNALVGEGVNQRERFLTGFYLQLREVTRGDFQAFLAATSSAPPRGWPAGALSAEQATSPVTGVTWQQASAYARWRGWRLPRSSEWEKAARGASGQRWPWGEAAERERCNWGPEAELAAVGSHPRDRSPFGCLDMAGNARELTLGPGSRTGQPKLRVCGGGVGSEHFANTRVAFHVDGVAPDSSDLAVGFRCALDELPPRGEEGGK